jgi:hypothetical protein
MIQEILFPKSQNESAKPCPILSIGPQLRHKEITKQIYYQCMRNNSKQAMPVLIISDKSSPMPTGALSDLIKSLKTTLK